MLIFCFMVSMCSNASCQCDAKAVTALCHHGQSVSPWEFYIPIIQAWTLCWMQLAPQRCSTYCESAIQIQDCHRWSVRHPPRQQRVKFSKPVTNWHQTDEVLEYWRLLSVLDIPQRKHIEGGRCTSVCSSHFFSLPLLWALLWAFQFWLEKSCQNANDIR